MCISERRSIILMFTRRAQRARTASARTFSAAQQPPEKLPPMYSLTEDQLAVQDLVRRVAREKVAPRADAIDRDAEYPQDMFELLREPRPVRAAAARRARRHRQPARRLHRGRGVRPRLLQHRLSAGGAVGRVRCTARCGQCRAEGSLPARPRHRRTAWRVLDDRSAERLGRFRDQDARDARRRRLSAERLEDLVHEFGRGRLRARRCEVRRRRRQGRHQSVHRRERHEGLQRRPQGRQDGCARRAVVPAVLRRRVRARSQPHGSGRQPGLQARDGSVQYEPPDRRRARRRPGAGCDRSRDRVRSVAQGVRSPHRRLPGPALDACRHGHADRGRTPAHVQGRLDGRCRRHRA